MQNPPPQPPSRPPVREAPAETPNQSQARFQRFLTIAPNPSSIGTKAKTLRLDAANEPFARHLKALVEHDKKRGAQDRPTAPAGAGQS